MKITMMLACAAALCCAFGADADYDAYKKEVLKEPSLIRFWTFEEGFGNEVRNHVQLEAGRIAFTGGPVGSLTIFNPTPWGVEPMTLGSQHYLDAIVNEWCEGRFDGKGAFRSGETKLGLFRSGITGAEFENGGSCAGWFRFEDRTSGGCDIMRLSDAWHKGFRLAYHNGWISFGIGGANGSGVGVGGAIKGSEKLWHHIAWTIGDGKIALYIDGKLSEEKACTNKIVGVQNFGLGDPSIAPFFENSTSHRSYLKIGADPRWKSEGKRIPRFQLDELAIYNRGLSAAEIAKLYEAGKVKESAETQLAKFNAWKARNDVVSKIKMEMPKESDGYFRINKAVPMSVALPQEMKGRYRAKIEIETLFGKPVKTFEKELGAGEEWTEDFTFPACGVYWIDMRVDDAAGKLVKRLPQKYCAGIIPPAPKELSKNNPMAYWSDHGCKFHFDAALRRMCIFDDGQVFEREYKNYAARIPNFRSYLICLTKNVRPPAEGWEAGRKMNREKLELYAKCFKGKNIDAFEMTSEPHDIDVKWYVQHLADAHEIFRREGLNQPMIPPGGAPPSIPMIDDILKGGGLKYMAGASYHPYQSRPISDYYMNNAGKRLREVLNKYDKNLVMWNTESGLSPLPRINGRPGTREQAHAMRWPCRDGYFLASIGTIPEEECAYKEVQDVLITLLNGFKIYTRCQISCSGGDPSCSTVALTALAGQIINNQCGVEILPLSSTENMCLRVKQSDGSTIAAFFGEKDSLLNMKLTPGAVYKTMDMYGNYGTMKADEKGLLAVNVSPRPFYVFGVPDSMSEIVSLKLDLAKQISERGKMSGKVFVENSFGRRIKGTVEAEQIKGAEISIPDAKFDLQPGEKKEFAYILNGTNLKRKPYSLNVLLREDGGNVLARANSVTESLGVIREVPRAKREMPLDGDLTKWEGIPEYVCDSEDGVVIGKPNTAEVWLPQWLGRDDLSFKMKTCWRKEDGIYFLLQVKDDVVMPATTETRNMAFTYDCLEFFVDTRPAKEQGANISDGADQVVVIPNGEASVKNCDLWYARKERAHVKVTCVGRKTAEGWMLEGRIAPNELTEFKVREGTQFFMDFMVDDTDRDEHKWRRKAAMALDGDSRSSISSARWGRYELAK